MLNFSLFPIDDEAGCFGFLVESEDGSFRVRADCVPGASGIQRMSEAEATTLAQACIAENTPAQA